MEQESKASPGRTLCTVCQNRGCNDGRTVCCYCERGTNPPGKRKPGGPDVDKTKARCACGAFFWRKNPKRTDCSACVHTAMSARAREIQERHADRLARFKAVAIPILCPPNGGRPGSLEQVGQALGISRERVRQIINAHPELHYLRSEARWAPRREAKDRVRKAVHDTAVAKAQVRKAKYEAVIRQAAETGQTINAVLEAQGMPRHAPGMNAYYRYARTPEMIAKYGPVAGEEPRNRRTRAQLDAVIAEISRQVLEEGKCLTPLMQANNIGPSSETLAYFSPRVRAASKAAWAGRAGRNAAVIARGHTPESWATLKLQVLAELAHGKTQVQAAQDHGISITTVHRWKRAMDRANARQEAS